VKRAFFAALGASASMGGARPGPLGLVTRPLGMVREALWGFLGGALSADEKSRLGVALYDAGSEYRAMPRYDWEDAWLARWLPPAPARVLVGGAGAGREVVALRERGHEVVAIEPSPDLAAECRAHTAGEVRIMLLRYEDLTPESLLAGERPFDAVLLGLGSLSHLLDHAARVRLLQVLAEVCPAGPILGSTPARPRVAPDRPMGRAAKLGRALARPIRAARGLPEVDPGEIVFAGLGFTKLFERSELIAVGDAVGRRTRFDEAAPDGMELCAFVCEGEGEGGAPGERAAG
jgi:hypothetical protein